MVCGSFLVGDWDLEVWVVSNFGCVDEIGSWCLGEIWVWNGVW